MLEKLESYFILGWGVCGCSLVVIFWVWFFFLVGVDNTWVQLLQLINSLQ